MKRSVFIICLVAVTMVCVIVGLCRNLGFVGKNSYNLGHKIASKIKDFDYDYDDDEAEDQWDDVFDKYIIDEDLPAFTNLNVNTNIMGLKIERGNAYHIEAHYNNTKLKPSYEVKNGMLSITQPKHGRMTGNKKCTLTITLPFGCTLDEFTINIDVGAVELSGFDIKNGFITTDVGAVSISSLDFEDLNISSDVGAVSISLVDDVDNYSINASSSVGAIEVSGKGVKRRYVSTGSNGKTLRIKTDVGGIEIK